MASQPKKVKLDDNIVDLTDESSSSGEEIVLEFTNPKKSSGTRVSTRVCSDGTVEILSSPEDAASEVPSASYKPFVAIEPKQEAPDIIIDITSSPEDAAGEFAAAVATAVKVEPKQEQMDQEDEDSQEPVEEEDDEE